MKRRVRSSASMLWAIERSSLPFWVPRWRMHVRKIARLTVIQYITLVTNCNSEHHSCDKCRCYVAMWEVWQDDSQDCCKNLYTSSISIRSNEFGHTFPNCQIRAYGLAPWQSTETLQYCRELVEWSILFLSWAAHPLLRVWTTTEHGHR